MPKEVKSKKVETKETPRSSKRLLRSRSDVVIAGVCSGLADYFDIDPIIVRVVFAIMLFAGGPGLILYIVLWVIIPEKENMNKSTEEIVKGNGKQIEERVTAYAKSVENVAKESNTKIWIGLFVIVLGTFLLLSSLGITSFVNWGWIFGNLWPLFIIGLGVLILVKNSDGKAK